MFSDTPMEERTNMEEVTNGEQMATANHPLIELASLILPVAQDEVEVFFDMGVRLYQSAQYETASKFFLFVCMARPLNASYLCAYGKSKKMSNDFKLAASIFQMAFLLDIRCAEYAVHAAECLLRCGRQTDAKSLLEIATNDPVLATNHRRIHAKASAWLKLIGSDDNTCK